MTGHTTVDLSRYMRSKSGSNQPSLHSQWESRKTNTPPVATFAPAVLARMRPSLWCRRTILTLDWGDAQSSSFCFKSSMLGRWVKSPCATSKQQPVIANKTTCSHIHVLLLIQIQKNTKLYYMYMYVIVRLSWIHVLNNLPNIDTSKILWFQGGTCTCIWESLYASLRSQDQP